VGAVSSQSSVIVSVPRPSLFIVLVKLYLIDTPNGYVHVFDVSGLRTRNAASPTTLP
jgi:hypothetical protein